MEERKSKIRGMLLGGAVGDALGYPIEFEPIMEPKAITSYRDGKGLISDDTQMTLFTANGLLWTYTRGALRGISLLPPDALYLAYRDWLSTQERVEIDEAHQICWIHDLSELNQLRAPGNTCLSALRSGKKGTIEDPINNSKGCGSVMRVAPIAAIKRGDIHEIAMDAAKAGAITHGHPLGVMPCYILVAMLCYILREHQSIADAIKSAMDLFREKFDAYNDDYKQEMIEIIDRAIELSKRSDLSDLEAIESLGGGWVAEEALAIALYSCLKHPDNFKDAVVCAVNHSGDSDSTGAIAGNIIGTSLGVESIPQEYLDGLELRDVIEELADDLSVDIPVSEYGKNDDKYWLSKYLYRHRDLSLRKETA